jgi:sigma-B regulation protein RsbU (phosphoserine phosphatase)
LAVDAVHSPDAALAAVHSNPFDLVLMDLNYTGDTTSGREGIDLLEPPPCLRRLAPRRRHDRVGLDRPRAVEAMRRGVRDFVQKPWDNTALVTTLRSEFQAGRERRVKAERDQRELEEARRIQRTLLPAVLPQMDGFELAASWQPASGWAADCFDAIRFSPHRLALSIADVVGKGIPAALLMSNLQAAVRAFATEAARPAELCERVNTILCGHISEGRFISFFYCVVDSEVGSLTYANAGHFPPALIKADGTLDSTDERRTRARRPPRRDLRIRDRLVRGGRSADSVHRRHHRGSQRERRGVRRRPACCRWPSSTALQRARAPGEARGCGRDVHRTALHRRRNTDGPGG